MDTSEGTPNAANNQSPIPWSVYIYVDVASPTYSFGPSSWSASINGVTVGGGSFTYDFRGKSAGYSLGLGSSTYTYTHLSDGSGTPGISVSAVADSPLGSASGSSSQPTTNFVRVPQAPAAPSVTRTSTGTSATVSSAVASDATGSPAPPAITDYKYRYSTDNSGWIEVTGMGADRVDTFGPTVPITVSATQVYYFQTAAYNSEGWGAWSGSTLVYGVPSPPTSLTATISATDQGKINLSWTAPTNTQGGITGYDIFVNDVFIQNTASTSAAVIKSDVGGTALTPGTTYTFKVAAKNALNTSLNTVANLSSSITTGVTAVAPGPPSAPTFGTNPPSKVGRNVTVTVINDSNAYGNAISNYYVQYRSAATSGGTYSAWSTPQLMTLNGANQEYTFVLLPAALWYKFRVYAKNSIINNSAGAITYYPDTNLSYTANFSPSSTGTTAMFVSAGGRRYRGAGETSPNTYQPTETAKRYGVEGAPPLSQTVKYWDLSNAKRWNGTAWVDLT